MLDSPLVLCYTFSHSTMLFEKDSINSKRLLVDCFLLDAIIGVNNFLGIYAFIYLRVK